MSSGEFGSLSSKQDKTLVRYRTDCETETISLLELGDIHKSVKKYHKYDPQESSSD